ncbi:hypothetical protein GJ744_000963 [Endocarpon pusillum]|uniref:Uncharacterized protein n=1 Tax=Endocarpon pusillum TaxID=364733 RepID=A0A8H7AE50_9EURO|nr:hypothetical protein GJ744_000963 [Endocarpon pusillum]
MAGPPSDMKDHTHQGVSGQMAKDPAHKPLQPLQTGQHPTHATTGISDEAAKTAHDFISSTTRRMSDAQSPHSPGLTDELLQQTHVFWDSNATRRKSHSKYLADETLPGMTDQVVEEVSVFVEAAEGEAHHD